MLEEDKRPRATGAWGCLWWSGLRRERFPGWLAVRSWEVGGGSGQQRLERHERWSTGRAPEAVIADRGTALRPHRLEEAAAARLGGTRAVCPPCTPTCCPSAGHVPGCPCCEAVVGDGHAAEGGGEGGNARGAGAGWCPVGPPGLVADVGGPVPQPPGSGQRGLARATAEGGAGSHRPQPILRARGEPGRVVWR